MSTTQTGCEARLAQMNDRLDGELSAAEAEAFDAHLRACPACRAEYEALKASVAMLADLPLVAAPSALKHQITARIHRQSRGAFFHSEHGERGPFALLRMPYELLALVIFVAVGSLYVLEHAPRPLAVEVKPVQELEKTKDTAGQPVAQQRAVRLPAAVDRARLRARLREEGWEVSASPAAAEQTEDGLLVWVPSERTPRFVELLRQEGVALPGDIETNQEVGVWVRLW